MGQCFGQDGVMGMIIHSFGDIFCLFQGCLTISSGYTVAQSVEAMCYKPEGRGFDSRWSHCDFSLSQSSARTVALGLTHPLTETRTRDISWSVKAGGA